MKFANVGNILQMLDYGKLFVAYISIVYSGETDEMQFVQIYGM